jgi:hypothetical protein
VKRTLLLGGVALAALVGAAAAWSSGVLGGGPAQIRVYGGGEFAAPAVHTISLDAAANPGGDAAYGTLRYAGVAPGFRGDVTCLSVFGDAAVVGGIVREGPANFVGADFLYGVIDNGPAGSGADQAGFLDVSPELDPYPGLPADFPKTCPTAEGAQASFGSFPLIGDVSIETP